ncbi:response regulator transcription factor [Sphingomonas pituitosa]|uniref:response regulator transcription factor n=1 Tax=Sphingomonas pituitosa TaxID=99597 RepID=UPI00082CE3B3|nr:response regulator [Sphingomonas pituitosa]
MTPLIAIVDDDPAVRGSVDSLLRSAGMRGRTFAAAEALLGPDRLEEFDCIVTDLHMPGMSGIDLQVELARRGCAHPLIVMTAFPTEAASARAMAAGARAFLGKPIDPDALLDAIEAVTPQ